jgi:hypothetical protein
VRERILEAIISRRPFSSVSDVVVGKWTVDDVCSLGLVQWQGSVPDPAPLVAPFILLLMLRHLLQRFGPLSELALSYERLETGSRAGNQWQDFEVFVANFRAVKVSAFSGLGWVPLAHVHYGARLSNAAKRLLVRSLRVRSVTVRVVHAKHRYVSKSSGSVKRLKNDDGFADVASGAVVVLNGAGAPAADIFLNSQATVSSSSVPWSLREAYACRHCLTESVNSAAFDKEWDKAAGDEDLFLFFASHHIEGVELDERPVVRIVTHGL